MDNSEKITLMQMQLKELKSLETANQSLIINRTGAIENELDDLKKQIEIVQQSLNKLLGDVSMINAEGKLKTSYKDYSGVDIYLMHNNQGLSWNKIASLIGCSKSTVIRKYKEYLYENMEVDF